jgi:hypothetical protein
MTAINLEAWGDTPPLWVQLLAAEVARSNITKAAARIGMHRASVSTALRNCYPRSSTAGIERRVLAKLAQLECPALDKKATADQCQEFREKPAPTHNPQAMQKWKACQHCKHNPNRIAKEAPDAR